MSASDSPMEAMETIDAGHGESGPVEVPMEDKPAATVAEDDDEDEDEFGEPKTLPFPKEVPLQNPYLSDEFFVRECFSDYYYRHVGRLFYNNMRGVTVTGAPGIGKSVFMAYFFLQYKEQYPDSTIIMISYDEQSIMRQIVVWDKGTIETEAEDETAMKQLLAKYLKNPNAIRLINGPPNIAPVTHKYVVFTDANESWFRKTSKDDTHVKIYLPPWDSDELVDAVDALGLNEKLGRLPDVEGFPRGSDGRCHTHEVEYRRDVFGGVARSCLSPNADVLKREFEELEAAVNTRTIMDIMTGNCSKETSRLLFHNFPDSDDPSVSRLRLASAYVDHLVMDQMGKLQGSNARLLRAMMPSAADLIGAGQLQ